METLNKKYHIKKMESNFRKEIDKCILQARERRQGIVKFLEK